jgi:hypothetical protein
MPLSSRFARAARFVRLGLVALWLAGCAETRLYSGKPPGEPARGFHERWHSAYLFGTTDAGRPYPLDKACPGGWSEIVVSQDTFTGILSLATLFLYTPSRVTVVCAREPSAHETHGAELHPTPVAPIDD